MQLKREYYLHLIKLALQEDIGDGDITTDAIIPPDSLSEAELIAKDDGIICGVEVFCDTMYEVDSSLTIEKYFNDGNSIKKGDITIKINGRTQSILKAERTALNFIQRMSGIATKTFNYTSKISQYKMKILDTRKTVPGFRMLDKYSVFTGKGVNHRIGLYDMFLIKENHIKVASEITTAVMKARNYSPYHRIEVETTNIDEVKEACLTNPDIIMLDNMDNSLVEKAASIIREHNSKRGKDIKIEASGNITEERLLSLAKIGIDFVSIGELTHSVKAFDFSLLINKLS